jgi:hypothetical protein
MKVNSVDRSPNWRPSGVDLYSTGASRPTPERKNNLATNNPSDTVAAASVLPANSVDAGKKTGPDTPVPAAQISNTDWTVTATGVEKSDQTEKTENPPPKPMYMKLIEHLQAMWRASGNAVEVVDELSKTVNPAKLVQPTLVYPDPKLKKVSNN